MEGKVAMGRPVFEVHVEDWNQLEGTTARSSNSLPKTGVLNITMNWMLLLLFLLLPQFCRVF